MGEALKLSVFRAPRLSRPNGIYYLGGHRHSYLPLLLILFSHHGYIHSK